MVDIFARLEKNAGGPIGQYMSYAHGYFAFPKLEGEIGPHMVFRGKKMLNWSLNNYLGLANHPEVRKADAEGAAKFGMAAPMGARQLSDALSTPSGSIRLRQRKPTASVSFASLPPSDRSVPQETTARATVSSSPLAIRLIFIAFIGLG